MRDVIVLGEGLGRGGGRGGDKGRDTGERGDTDEGGDGWRWWDSSGFSFSLGATGGERAGSVIIPHGRRLKVVF